MFQGLGNWVVGLLFCVLSIIGLFIAAKGATMDSYAFGLGLFFVAVIGVAHLIRRSWDKGERHSH